ncbi:diphosphate--fructose-6-phosphate 1-phosphotransferase [Virgibacillus proomii]|uniref:diphosphate--fructose-6-phosphate 1-phosphotransferase n=1 Tax=Virgibacillus proomii TaxID=84407 RepID=UPI0009856563|nr:diphosphate--fructose-6-phosphate 1-phosphotransferase [Virgibacillus proomii]
MTGNCMIVQSGGPTAVINNSMVGIIDGILQSSFEGKIYGAIGGIHGLLHDSFIRLDQLSISDRYRLRWTPGAALGTWRHKLTYLDLDKILNVLKAYHVRYFFYIGGNGSMKALKLIDDFSKKASYELCVIGVPKSIDNDLLGTDHCPGYGSTAKFLATSVLDVKMDMSSYPESNGVTIIETMGRHTGWVAAACSLAERVFDEKNELLIYIPEVPFDLSSCLAKVVNANEEKRNIILVIAEGIKTINGQFVNEDLQYDSLGRPKLGGVSAYLKKQIESKTGIKTRYITSSVWQRSNMMLASKTDVDESYLLGKEAINQARRGNTGVMTSMKRDVAREDYCISFATVSLEKVAGKERYMPEEWYDTERNRMTREFKTYASPFIQGEMIIPMENGLPVYKRVI